MVKISEEANEKEEVMKKRRIIDFLVKPVILIGAIFIIGNCATSKPKISRGEIILSDDIEFTGPSINHIKLPLRARMFKGSKIAVKNGKMEPKNGTLFGATKLLKEDFTPIILQRPTHTTIMTIFHGGELFAIGLQEICNYISTWGTYGAKIYVGKGGVTLRGLEHPEGTKLQIDKHGNPLKVKSFGSPLSVIVDYNNSEVLEYPFRNSRVLARIKKGTTLPAHFSAHDWYLIQLPDEIDGWIHKISVSELVH